MPLHLPVAEDDLRQGNGRALARPGLAEAILPARTGRRHANSSEFPAPRSLPGATQGAIVWSQVPYDGDPDSGGRRVCIQCELLLPQDPRQAGIIREKDHGHSANRFVHANGWVLLTEDGQTISTCEAKRTKERKAANRAANKSAGKSADGTTEFSMAGLDEVSLSLSNHEGEKMETSERLMPNEEESAEESVPQFVIEADVAAVLNRTELILKVSWPA